MHYGRAFTPDIPDDDSFYLNLVVITVNVYIGPTYLIMAIYLNWGRAECWKCLNDFSTSLLMYATVIKINKITSQQQVILFISISIQQ